MPSWSLRLSVRTAGFHPAKGGSIPPGTANIMAFYVYMIKSITDGSKKSYVGYTNNVKQRLKKHNSNKGAKSTKGYKWIVIYQRYFKTKNEAMSYEYRLKNDKRKRSKLLKNEDFNSTAL